MRDQRAQGVSRRELPERADPGGDGRAPRSATPAMVAAEPPPETTKLRLLKRRAESAGPRSTSPRTCCGPKASPT